VSRAWSRRLLRARQVIALMEVDLRAGTAWPDVAREPVVALLDAIAHDPLRALALGEPEIIGLLVVFEDRVPEALGRDTKHPGHELPGPGNGVLLEVIADTEVAEHLEEGLVVPVLADLVDVRRPEDLLHRDDPLGGRLLLSEEIGHERLHAGAGEKHARVVLQDERPAGHTGVPLLLKEGNETLSYGRAVQFALLLNENAGATSAPRVPRFEKNTRQSLLVEPPGVLRVPVDARPAELESHCFFASSISSRPFTEASSASF